MKGDTVTEPTDLQELVRRAKAAERAADRRNFRSMSLERYFHSNIRSRKFVEPDQPDEDEFEYQRENFRGRI